MSIWNSETTAAQLLSVLPRVGRFIGQRMRELGADDMTMMQMQVLAKLQEQRITASELAKKRNVSLQAASVLVQGLVERGLVTRVADPNDRRQFMLEITPEGLAQSQATQDQLVSHLATYLDQLTPEEIAAAQVFLPALQRVLATELMTEATPSK